MANVSGTITLNAVTDQEMELIWGFKAKHEVSSFSFVPNVMQPQNLNGRAQYNNVVFNYNNIHGLNLVTEIVNALHKKEETKSA